MSELATRTASGVVAAAIALAALWLGGIAFWVLAVLAGLVMLHEFAGLLGASRDSERIALYALTVALALLSPLAAGPGFFALGTLFGMAIAVVAITRQRGLAIGLIYVGLPVFALVWLRAQGDSGLLYAFWGLGLVWATDIGAYFAGRAIGGPKIAPAISPNKTWAGLIGGMVSALGFGLTLNTHLGLPLALALACPLLAIAAQVGDFFESWLKRRAGVKDSGKILPGHGGALDRLDGVATSAPLAALILFAVLR